MADSPVKRPVKLGLWLLGFAVLAMLGLWLEHERAKARLAAFKAQLIAKGEKLAIADHVPKLPPALSNAAPDFIAAANRLTELKPEFQPQRMRLIAPGKARVTWQQPELPTDKEPDLWPFVTAHVEDNRDRLAEMATALERPEMVFDLDYPKGFSLLIPHLQKLRLAALQLSFACVVDLHGGQTNSAFTNVLAAVRVGQRLQEPLLISQLVRVAAGQIAQQATWEALQHPGWTDSQLRELQAAWQITDLRTGWLGALGMERAIGSSVFQQFRQSPGMLDENTSGMGGSGRSFWDELFHDPAAAATRTGKFGFGLVWAGWLSYSDEQWALTQQQLWHTSVRQAWTNQASAPAEQWLKRERGTMTEPPRLQRFLSSVLASAIDNYNRRMVAFETVRRLTFTAIALHRHRLQHGKFPESLSALVPGSLAEIPRDFMDGLPLRYKLQSDGKFLLWSVGEDFKDDGGDPTPVGVASGSSNLPDWLKGRDWVWPQAATEAEVAAYHAGLAAKRALSAPKPPP